jgi:hypothetical protein
MNAAARVAGSDVVAGRVDLIRGGRARGSGARGRRGERAHGERAHGEGARRKGARRGREWGERAHGERAHGEGGSGERGRGARTPFGGLHSARGFSEECVRARQMGAAHEGRALECEGE